MLFTSHQILSNGRRNRKRPLLYFAPLDLSLGQSGMDTQSSSESSPGKTVVRSRPGTQADLHPGSQIGYDYCNPERTEYQLPERTPPRMLVSLKGLYYIVIWPYQKRCFSFLVGSFESFVSWWAQRDLNPPPADYEFRRHVESITYTDWHPELLAATECLFMRLKLGLQFADITS